MQQNQADIDLLGVRDYLRLQLDNNTIVNRLENPYMRLKMLSAG